MGRYIQTPGRNKNKWDYMVLNHEAVPISQPKSFSDIPSDKALICIVDNGLFEAVAYCYCARDWYDFSDSSDIRPKTWLLMDKELAERLAK